MSQLTEYKRKRDFKKTPEPGAIRSKSKAQKLMFVVQEHHASHLHYDFRLEWNGVLKSWSVPKGPSPDPQQKRLAVQVEDHPYDYGNFEGEIPLDEYGGGEVLIWDTGAWEPEGDVNAALKKGHLDFTMKGKRMKGKWTLIRTRLQGGKPNWLLFKRSDQYSKPFSADSLLEASDPVYHAIKRYGSKKERGKSTDTKVTRAKKSKNSDDDATATATDFIPPQLALLVEHPPEGKEWVHEVKFDGYRIQAHLRHGEVTLLTRTEQDWTHRYPTIAAELDCKKIKSAILDGELTALNKQGQSDFQEMQLATHEGQESNLVYYVFDLLELNGEDTRQLTLLERKELLKDVVKKIGSPLVKISEHFEIDGEKFIHASCEQGLEGIISKRVDSIYSSGRGEDWVKSKCKNRQEFVIGGYTDPQGARKRFGALLLGVYDGSELRYVGKCGTGFNSEILDEVWAKMHKIEQDESPFDLKSPRWKGTHWLKPKLVAEVNFANWTRDEILRVPVFQGLREDKKPMQIVHEVKAKASKGKKAHGKATQVKSAITHPEKLLFRSEEISKQDVVDYYSDPMIQKAMMPLLQGRPLALNRCPDGTESECFYQKHLKGQDNISVNALDDLLKLVQMGAFELHAWGCREPDIEHPDQIVMDFDPAPDVPFIDVKRAAFDFKEMLDHLGLRSYLKVTGGKGLHVHIPIKPKYSWDQVKAFSKTMAEELVSRFPKRFVSVSLKKLRTGKIFVDYLRNGRSATAVVPYSLRAKRISSVAMPIEWDELKSIKDPAKFTLKKALEHLKKRKRDPWKGILELQDVEILNQAKGARARRR